MLQAPLSRDIIVVFSDGNKNELLQSIAREVGDSIHTALSVADALEACRRRQFDVMLFVGYAPDIIQVGEIRKQNGWLAEMPIIAVCKGAMDLSVARSAGITILIPADTSLAAIKGALIGSLMVDPRNSTWWFD